ncbi:PREDICTED: uncharacterized protein LOC103340900 [Prunus mume]|uniref:Uncharacterized protein LOC103340900 n=1 Tax=Prunus mume TaxID=102107 RepID=A0ABM1LJJ2_PRUMU|nr:PREDICTED: uncharacterized protein LOC103340900 [Prunus mume]
MGKNLRDENSNNPSGNEHSAGCVWGLLHIMKYHHWHYVKKRLVHKRHRWNKHAAVCFTAGVRDPGNDANASTQDASMQEENDAKIDNSTDEGKMRQSIPTVKNVKARIKARIAGEISKKKGRHNRSSSCPARSQLKRTESIHHLEPPSHLDPIADMVLNEGSPRIVHLNNKNSAAASKPESLPTTSYEEPTSGNNNCGESCPIVLGDHKVHEQVDENQQDHTLIQDKLDDNTMQDMLEQKLIHVKELDADASALDIINVNKELLVKILHDPGSPLAQHFHNQQAVSAKTSLSKSESFPVPGSSDRRGSEPIKLKHKHELIRSPAKEESKSKIGSQAQKLAGSTSLKYVGERSMPSINEYSEDGILKLNQAIADNSYSGSADNEMAIKRFKDLRQKIKHVIKESRKERHMITMDALLHKIPHGQKLTKELEQEIDNHSKDLAMSTEGKDSPGSSYESDNSVSSLKKKKQRHMRRASSLNASLDRYCQLYETSCSREAKGHASERLKLRKERVDSPLQPVLKTLGRIFSLPEIKSYKYQSEESSDVFSSGAPTRFAVDGRASRRSSFDEQNSLDIPIGSENHLQLDAPVESKTENLAEVGELEVASTSVANNEASAPVDSIFDDIENLTAGNSVSYEEQNVGPRSESIINHADPFPISVPDFTVSLSEGAEMNMSHLQVDARDMAEFNYVRDVLEQSGFNGNESLGAWHSDDQPVDPLAYEGVEGCLVHDPDCSGNEEGGKCDHFLLFDMINEVLMEIYGRSYTYCPMTLSSLCNIPLMPAGHHVLKQVWALVSWYLSLRPEFDQSLDYVVSRDLAKNDGWMNLQFDSECIGIELEDLIFDDLLEEVSLSLWMDQVPS